MEAVLAYLFPFRPLCEQSYNRLRYTALSCNYGRTACEEYCACLKEEEAGDESTAVGEEAIVIHDAVRAFRSRGCYISRRSFMKKSHLQICFCRKLRSCWLLEGTTWKKREDGDNER